VRLGWLLVITACHHGAAPPAPSCQAVGDHVRALLGPGSPRAPRIRDAFAARCDVDGWDADARSCVLATTSLQKPRHCKAKLTSEQRAALERDLAGISATPAAARLPSTCRDYRMMIEKVGSCAGLPVGTRAALEASYRELTEAWTRGLYDAHTLEVQCRTMVDGLRRGVAATCGW
jgi:hypothetical protein